MRVVVNSETIRNLFLQILITKWKMPEFCRPAYEVEKIIKEYEDDYCTSQAIDGMLFICYRKEIIDDKKIHISWAKKPAKERYWIVGRGARI